MKPVNRLATIMGVLICVQACTLHAQEPVFQVAAADAELRVNFGMIERAVRSFMFTEYQGRFRTDVPDCEEAKLRAKLNHASLTTDSEVDLASSISMSLAHAQISFMGEVSHCILPLGIRLECKATMTIADITEPIPYAGGCRYATSLLPIPTAVPFKISDPIPPIARVPSSIPVALRSTPEIEIEFGDFVDGLWVTAQDAKRKEIALASTLLGKLPTRQSSNLRELVNVGNQVWSGRITVGRKFTSRVRGAKAIEAEYGGAPGFDVDQHIVQLALWPSLFGRVSLQGERSGLLNELLPIRLKGEVGGQRVDIALTDASVEFGIWEGRSALRAEMKVRSVKSGAYIETSVASMVFSLPEIVGGRVVMRLISARVQLTTKDFGAEICLDWLIKENFVLELVEIAEITEEVTLALPDCIEIDNDDIRAERPCASGVSRGFLSRHGTMTNAKLRARLNLASVTLHESGALLLSVPGELLLEP